VSLTLLVPDEIAEAAQELSQRYGQTPEQLLLQALRAHFPPIPDALRAEFEALERASDEDFKRFEPTD
jgi:hypothetical protein